MISNTIFTTMLCRRGEVSKCRSRSNKDVQKTYLPNHSGHLIILKKIFPIHKNICEQATTLLGLFQSKTVAVKLILFAIKVSEKFCHLIGGFAWGLQVL